MEVERKFIIPRNVIDQFEVLSIDCIEQYYISTDPEIRYRKIGEKIIKTEKSKGGISRLQEENNVLKHAFKKNQKKLIGSLIRKVRVTLKYNEKLKLEVDIYIRPYTDKVIAEIEFESDIEASQFTPPKNWEDISYNAAYKNVEIAQHGFPKNAEKTTYVPSNIL